VKTHLALAFLGVAATVATAGPKEETWTKLADAKWTPLDPKDTAGKGPQFSVVFGDMKKKGPIGFMLKMPPGFKAGPHTHTSDDYAMVIQGTVHNFKAPGTDTGPGLTAGGSWFQPAGQAHDNECEASSKDGCIVYIYMANGFDFKPWTEPAKKEPAKK
jgi:quercetin dioxygenase-like cupin family protein